MTDPGLDPILAYLREHAGRYSLPALREQLVRSGYDPARVDEAMAVYQEQNPPAPRSRIWPKALLVLAVNSVLIAVQLTPLSGPASNVLGSILFFLFCAEFVAGLALSFRAASRSWALGLLVGVLFTIAVGILAAGGLCLYGLTHGANH
jgi:hypothetical protein